MKQFGKVKWWSDKKGYGFIEKPHGADVFVHYSAIQADGYRTLRQGENVEFEEVNGPAGPQAEAVISLENPEGNLIARFDLTEPSAKTSIIEVSKFVDHALIEYFSKHPEEMKVMNRRKFEELIAELFYGFGYEIELTKMTRDGGRDIVAIKRKEIEVKYLIECKRPDPGGYVGVRPVRELYGVKTSERATKAILATTAYFSPDALLIFDKHKWELEPRDYNGLIEWLESYLNLHKS